MVNWPTVSRPKDMGMGSLGVLDLEKLSRALRLCLLWKEWIEEDKAWVGMEVSCNEMDRFLFNASTIVNHQK